ncbi:Short coiled-coil protein A, partial [Nibea albiflora]
TVDSGSAALYSKQENELFIMNCDIDGDMENQVEMEEKTRLINQVLELQHTLEDLSARVDAVKEENLKLKSENQVLGQYIENLMSASSVFQTTDTKSKRKHFDSDGKEKKDEGSVEARDGGGKKQLNAQNLQVGDSSDRSTSRREGETRQGEAGCGLGDCGPGMGVAEAVDGAAGVTAGYQVVWRKYMLLCSARRCEWGGEQQ